MAALAGTLRILRPHNMAAAAACVWCGYHLAGGNDLGRLTWPLVVTALVTGLGNMINDYYDADIDRINKPHRPIPAGLVARRHVAQIYWVASIAAASLAVKVLPFRLFVLIVTWQVALYLYARFGKRVPLVGNVLVAAVVASSFMAGAVLTGDYDRVAFPLFFAFLLVMGRELVKGAEDVRGDEAAGAATVAVKLGVTPTVHGGVLVLLACVIAAPIPALTTYYGRAYGLAVEFGFVPGVLAAVVVALGAPRRERLSWASRILKLEMLFGIAALALGPL